VVNLVRGRANKRKFQGAVTLLLNAVAQQCLNFVVQYNQIKHNLRNKNFYILLTVHLELYSYNNQNIALIQ
jgi:hypothetical protein